MPVQFRVTVVIFVLNHEVLGLWMTSNLPDAFLVAIPRFDDHHDGGRVSRFRLRIASAVRAMTSTTPRRDFFKPASNISLPAKFAARMPWSAS